MACEWDVDALICVAGNYYVIMNGTLIKIWCFSVAGIILICWGLLEYTWYKQRNRP